MHRPVIRSGMVLLLLPALFLLTLPGVGSRAYAGQDVVETDPGKAWIGKKARGFTLPGIDGKPVNIARSLGKRPVVLIFYRGVW